MAAPILPRPEGREPPSLASAEQRAPTASVASTLQWTPLGDAAPEAPVSRPARRVDPGIARAEAPAAGVSGALVEALREAPGLLAEAWSALEAAARAIRAGLGTSGGEQLDVYGRDARLSEAVAVGTAAGGLTLAGAVLSQNPWRSVDGYAGHSWVVQLLALISVAALASATCRNSTPREARSTPQTSE